MADQRLCSQYTCGTIVGRHKEEVKLGFIHLRSLAYAAAQLENMNQKTNESLKNYVHRY